MGDTFDGEPWLQAGVARPVCRGWPGDRGRPGQGRLRAGESGRCGDGQRDLQPGMDAQRLAGHGGDGLGPVYNDSSCVACHNSGGNGGQDP